MPVLAEELGVDLVVGPLRVAAVDDQVPVLEQRGEAGDGVPGDPARGDHHPDDPGRGERLDQRSQARDVGDLGVGVVPRDLEALLAQAGAHVPAHLAQTDESDVHDVIPLV
jgi:hypothetical protein